MVQAWKRVRVVVCLVGLLIAAAAARGETRTLQTGGFAFELEDGWAGTVEQVWRHFLIERFKPYMESKSGS